jgi:TATA-binding protein-associated factor Taf7
MLVVERATSVQDLDEFRRRPLSPRSLVSEDGLTPPLKFCRKRRFRKRRFNKRTMEDIESEVARLLLADRSAQSVVTQLIDHAPEEDDQELMEMYSDSGTPGRFAHEYGDVNMTPAPDDVEEDDGEGSDPEFAAELEQQITQAFVDTSEEEEEEEEDEDEDEDEDEQDDDADADDDDEDEVKAMYEEQTMIAEEIKDLEEKIQEKSSQISTSMNQIIKVCGVGRLSMQSSLTDGPTLPTHRNDLRILLRS